MLRKSYFIAIVVAFAIIVVAGVVYQRLVPGLSQEKKARMARPR
jgi:hypothetical protein